MAHTQLIRQILRSAAWIAHVAPVVQRAVTVWTALGADLFGKVQLDFVQETKNRLLSEQIG